MEFLSDGSEKHVNKMIDVAIRASGAKQATVYNALEELVQEGKVEKVRQGCYRKFKQNSIQHDGTDIEMK